MNYLREFLCGHAQDTMDAGSMIYIAKNNFKYPGDALELGDGVDVDFIDPVVIKAAYLSVVHNGS